MSFKRWKAGKPPRLSAAGWNGAMESAEAFARELRAQLVGAGGPGPRGGTVLVKNATEAAQNRSCILGLGDPINTSVGTAAEIDTFYENVCFIGESPTLADHRYQWAILERDLTPDEIGVAILEGLAVCQVNILSEDHPRATIEDDEPANLESSFWGRAEILWTEGGTGLKWCIVELGPFTYPIIRGKTTGAIAKGSTGTVTVWLGTGAAASASGTTITSVYNPYVAVGATKMVAVGWVNDGPELITGECG